MTQIPKPYVEDMPLGTILPFLKAEDVPDHWVVLDGRSIQLDEHPDLVTKMWKRWSDHMGSGWAEEAMTWWLDRGGYVLPRVVKLPDIGPDEVTALAFGATYLADDAEPVLAIKAERLVISDAD